MGIDYYVTGTDTGGGKTLVSVACCTPCARWRRAVGMKPVASGCVHTPMAGAMKTRWRCRRQASRARPTTWSIRTPLPEATAPQIAAAAPASRSQLPPILSAYQALAATADAVVVEGVGGWLAPLADDWSRRDLVRALDVPVVLVVGIKLGCLSHARLSEQAIIADDCQLAGWVGNAVSPDMDFSDEYFVLLRRALQSPCLGLLPYSPGAQPASLAAHLRLPARP